MSSYFNCNAGKRLQQLCANRHGLQFVPEDGMQTEEEKGGGRGRKALM